MTQRKGWERLTAFEQETRRELRLVVGSGFSLLRTVHAFASDCPVVATSAPLINADVELMTCIQCLRAKPYTRAFFPRHGPSGDNLRRTCKTCYSATCNAKHRGIKNL